MVGVSGVVEGGVAQSLTSGAVGWPAVLASMSLVLLALVLARWLRLRIERELVEASLRAAGQLLLVGLVFAFIFGSAHAIWWSWLWVVVMATAATVVVVRRAGHRIRGLPLVTAGAIVGTSLLSIAVTFGFGVVAHDPVSVVVVAGITIGNAVPSAVLGVNLSVASCRDRVGSLEALLSLGFDRREIVRFMAPRTARASVIPQVERTKVVGLIALPGAMTGLLLAGVEPVEAVVVQLLVMYLILGSATVCVLASVVTVTRSAVSPGLQLEAWVRDPPDHGDD